MTFKTILLNCVILNAVCFYSAKADPDLPWYIDDQGFYIIQGDYSIPEDGMNIPGLVMTDNASLTWNDGGNNYHYIDDATFSGVFSDMGLANDANGQPSFAHTLFATKTTFDDLVVNGHYNQNKPVITWGDLTSFWSNELFLTGNVTMTNAQIGVETDSVKSVGFFENAEAFNWFETYDSDVRVVWNGGLYITKEENQQSFMHALYADLASKVSDHVLTPIDEMDQYTSVVGTGQSYKTGDVIQVVGTNEFLYSVGLISDYSQEQASSVRILAFKVNSDMNTLTPADILTSQDEPFSYESGVTISDANVTLHRTSVMAHQNIDPLQRLAMGQEFSEILGELHELDGLLDDDLEFISTRLDTLDLENGPDEFWNVLREYYYDDEYENEDIKQAYIDTDIIHTKYLKAASFAKTLPVTIQNSTVLSDNSSLQKHDSGNFVVDNSTITLYGMPDSLMPNDIGGSVSLLNHSGATGDIIIQNNSVLNLYPFSNLHREGESGNIYIIGSIINMMGDNTTYTDNIGEAGASIWLNTGNIQLTDDSVLNIYGMENGITLPDSDWDFSDENWQEKLQATSLYVNSSLIDIKENSYLDIDSDYNWDEIEWDKIKLGTIVMDVDSVINVRGGLRANIVSLNTDIDAGRINLYDNAWVDGKIHRANLFVNPDSEGEIVNVYGRLSLSDSVLDLGANTLKFNSSGEAFSLKYGEDFQELFAQYGVSIDETELDTEGFLYLNNSTIITHIDLANNTNGIINVEKLEFGETPSVVKIVVDGGSLDSNGATFDFLTGDKEIGENLVFSNVMYNITYNNGQLTLVPNGNSGIISLDALNNSLAANSWLSDGFESGSKAKVIADLLNELAQTDMDAFKEVIKQIQPDTTSSQQANSQSNTNQLANVVEAHMGHGNSHHGHSNNGHHGHGGVHHGHSGGDVLNKSSVWAQGLYNKSKLNTTDGFNGDTYGFALGADTEITKNLTLGLGYAYSKSDIDVAARNTDVDSYTGLLYGQYSFGNAFVNGIATYGLNKYQEKSNIKTAKYDMDTIFAKAATGYNFYVDSFSFVPQTGIRYLWTNTHSYTDSTEQHISGNKTNTLTGVLGGLMSVELQSSNVVWTPSVKASATYDMIKDTDVVNVVLANGSGYTISNSSMNRFGAEFGVGLSMNYESLDLSLNYDIEIRENYTSQTGMVQFKYNF